MITTDLWRLSHPDALLAASYGTRAKCEEWRDRNPMQRPPETYLIERVDCCHCCGDDISAVRERRGSIARWSNGQVRCDRHHDRNPCAIEGCTRTREAPKQANGSPYLANDQVLCSEHWRRYVPPRSKLRRHYHLIFRRAKREGWTDGLERRFWRYWTWLVAQARRKATGGDLDIAAIERMFGL